MDRFKELLKTTPFRIGMVVFGLIVLGVVYYFASEPLEMGKKVVCRYKHTISDNTYTLRVPKAFADRFKADKETSICAKHTKAEKLYAQAQKDIAAKKYSKAKKTLKEVEEIDPKFKKTKAQLTALNRVSASSGSSGGSSSGTSGSDTGSDAGNDTGNDTGGEGSSGTSEGDGSSSGGSSGSDGTSSVPIDLPALLPQVEIPGYSKGTLLESGNSAQIDYVPKPDTRIKISSLLITVRNMDTADKAKSFINNTSKIAWPNDQKSLSIKGHQAYSGTNIYGYANLSWPSDVVVYEVQALSAKSTPEKLYDDLVKITDYLP